MFELDHPTLADLQEYHRELDAAKGFEQDIYLNSLLLQEEVGELAAALIRAWHAEQGGESRQAALAQQAESLGEELADCLAYVVKLANYAGLDLEAEYLRKMRLNLTRKWRR